MKNVEKTVLGDATPSLLSNAADFAGECDAVNFIALQLMEALGGAFVGD
jgi:presenilin-like A22 family membrane protease